ncbi:MAG: HAMP domain-containing histidine kinase [Ktedonobacterales bacterium]|nr:HAMP domain-containing histidine kinase [Ktedonobacterales bacterium]
MTMPSTLYEREIYREYDRDRRLRVTRNFSATFFILLLLALVTTPLTLGITPTVAQIVGALWPPFLAVIGYAISWWLTLRKQDIWAAAFFIGATLFVVVEFQIQYAVIDGVGPLTIAIMGAYCNNIANTGIIGNTWLLVGVTLLENALTVLLLVGLPVILGQPFLHQLPVVTSTLIMIQWGMGLSFYFGNRQNLRTLRELGDVRIAYERAQQVEAIKNQFITSVNHELRTPMMTMIGWIENLQETAATIAANSQEREVQATAARMVNNLKRAEAAGQNFTALINSILDASRLDQDLTQYTPHPVNVLEVVHAAVALLDPPTTDQTEREIHLQLVPDLTIAGDPVWLQQIVVNLLSNAIKYSPAGGPIAIRAQIVAERRRGKKAARMVAEITVRDYGLGIPPEQAPLLFNKFIRLPRDLASTIIGNGLGLWLCRELTQTMGGAIWVESPGNEGEGATFFVQLPLATPPAASSSPLVTAQATRIT